MLRAYGNYFEKQIGDYQSVSSPRNPTVLALAQEIPNRGWRPDARYFLARNMYEMIIRPYRSVKRTRTIGSQLDIWPLVQEDLLDVISLSEKIAESRGRGYVSSTSVLIALGEMAENLRTSSLQIWGPET